MILLSPYLLSEFIVEGVVLALGFIALFWAIKIALDFDINQTNTYQYELATKSYLVATIIFFILVVKLPLFLYFIWTMDTLSSLISGAMCAVGVVSGSEYGTSLIALKIANLFLLCGWLLLHLEDQKSITSQYTKLKFFFFQPLFLLLVLEFILEISHFSKLSTQTPVACCSVIFSHQDAGAVPFYQHKGFILGLFFVSFTLFVLSGVLKRAFFFSFFSLLFGVSSLYALIRFFSPYIYELPTHMCPFCILQSGYYFVGYPIYILMFLGVLFSLIVGFLCVLKQKVEKKYYIYALFCHSLLFLVLLAYPLWYYVKNGVWL